MKYRHYAPQAPVTVLKGPPQRTAEQIRALAAPGDGVLCFSEWTGEFPHCVVRDLGPADDVPEQARRVFDALRSFDSTSVSAIWAQCPEETGLGLAVANRLNKAAGFRILDLREEEI